MTKTPSCNGTVKQATEKGAPRPHSAWNYTLLGHGLDKIAPALTGHTQGPGQIPLLGLQHPQVLNRDRAPQGGEQGEPGRSEDRQPWGQTALGTGSPEDGQP